MNLGREEESGKRRYGPVFPPASSQHREYCTRFSGKRYLQREGKNHILIHHSVLVHTDANKQALYVYICRIFICRIEREVVEGGGGEEVGRRSSSINILNICL
jgi:hypothetical protein